jgi:ankyrin repeat protein
MLNGASVDSRDKGGQTPLHYIAKSGNYRLIPLLVERGANVNAKDFEGC